MDCQTDFKAVVCIGQYRPAILILHKFTLIHIYELNGTTHVTTIQRDIGTVFDLVARRICVI